MYDCVNLWYCVNLWVDECMDAWTVMYARNVWMHVMYESMSVSVSTNECMNLNECINLNVCMISSSWYGTVCYGMHRRSVIRKVHAKSPVQCKPTAWVKLGEPRGKLTASKSSGKKKRFGVIKHGKYRGKTWEIGYTWIFWVGKSYWNGEWSVVSWIVGGHLVHLRFSANMVMGLIYV